MSLCPYCGVSCETVREEIEHMNNVHPGIVTQRLLDAGFSWKEIEELSASLPADLRSIIDAVHDLARYRRIPIGEDLARAVAFELKDRVSKLPEVKEIESG